jgi:hypothetical protein
MNVRQITVAAMAAFAGMAPLPTWAHPGHGANPAGNDVVHHLWEPVHFMAWAVPIGLFLFVAFVARRIQQASLSETS